MGPLAGGRGGGLRRHVEEIDRFFGQIEPEKYLVVAHADLRSRPEQVADGFARFLDLDEPMHIRSFLDQQRAEPTSFRAPVTDLRLQSDARQWGDVGNKLLGLAGPIAAALGYHPDESS